MWNGFIEKSKRIIETKIPKNPIFTFLNSANGSKSEKLSILAHIDKFYNLAKVVKDDFRQVGDLDKLKEKLVRENLKTLLEFCQKTKSPHFLQHVLGQSYQIDEPISWRYQNGNQFEPIVDSLAKKGFATGQISIKRVEDEIHIQDSQGKSLSLCTKVRVFHVIRNKQFLYVEFLRLICFTKNPILLQKHFSMKKLYLKIDVKPF